MNAIPKRKFQVLSLTDAAAERIRELGSNKPGASLRLTLKKGGCAGFSYGMDLVDDSEPGDELVEDRGVRLFVDPKAVLFLLGTVMDYKVSKLSAGFTFENPNQVSACGCGESVSLKSAAPEALALG